MCQGSVCYYCNKKTWSSCGQPELSHLQEAFGDTPKEYWCNCVNVINDFNDYPPSMGTGIKRKYSITPNDENLTKDIKTELIINSNVHQDNSVLNSSSDEEEMIK